MIGTTLGKSGSFFALLACGMALLPTVRADDARIYRPFGTGATAPTPAPAAPVATAKAEAAPAPASVPSAPATYTVQKGDTLWKLSKKWNVSVDALKKANHLTSDQIAVGTALSVPGVRTLSAAAPTEEVRRAEAVSASAPAVAAAPAPSAPAVAVIPASATLPDKVGAASSQADLQRRFLAETKVLAAQGIGYDRDWTPPGEGEAWDMDCSNTSRYLYKKVAGISMSRTASDQYYDLHQQGRAWDVPLDAESVPDVAWLESHLRVGDLLFWQNTYKPRRDPAITHVMIYLGKNNRGQWLMAGSQTAGGFFNTSGSGPDVYVFKPTATVGGYYKNLGFTHVPGRFVAFGRPLAVPQAPVQIAAR
ncbi:MAG TPA: LysM peptidoglycan-binding domain-containing protein [Candidatus Methylacidiphilales bacterium]